VLEAGWDAIVELEATGAEDVVVVEVFGDQVWEEGSAGGR
jgi:hypothetical protein